MVVLRRRDLVVRLLGIAETTRCKKTREELLKLVDRLRDGYQKD